MFLIFDFPLVRQEYLKTSRKQRGGDTWMVSQPKKKKLKKQGQVDWKSIISIVSIIASVVKEIVKKLWPIKKVEDNASTFFIACDTVWSTNLFVYLYYINFK